MNKKDLMKQFQKTPEKYWKLDFFKENGWGRKKCKKCGKIFWSLTDEDICADAGCKPYEFLGKSITNKKYDYFKAWKVIQDFFKKEGHFPLERYPVLCKWFPLHFTIAGIVDFYRMDGDKFVFEFPKSPVILLQPSLRFNDIPQVGISGRHWTCHSHIEQACEYDGKKGYWKERAIELDFKMLTKVFGIKPEGINFIEDVWLGAGAFGYSLEYFTKGIELGNCVFTEFQGTPDNFKPLEKKVIDMGAGLERFCWVSQGTATSYDAVLGPVIEKLKRKSGLKLNEKEFLKFSKYAGTLNLDDVPDLDKEMENIAKKIGMDIKHLKEVVSPVQAIYAITDHARALAFALTDGGIPSNVGGGYNLRVILRRSLNFINKYNLPFDLYYVIEKVSEYFKPAHPELVGKLDKIREMIELEERKYKNSVKNAEKIISSIRNITEEKMIELYDSHGITPEVLKEAHPKLKIPADFYAKVTEKHMGAEKEEREKCDYDVKLTKKLYYDDVKKFKAKVLKVYGEKIILDQTGFYPTSGGQECDHGTLNGKRVYDVQIENGVIVHGVEGKFKVGEKVEGEIDWKRRLQIVKHHTATHLINGAARKILGEHVWQAGSKKDEEKAHLDISHYDNIDDKTLKKIEKLANEFIRKKIKIEKKEMERMKAEEKFGFIIYQGAPVPSKKLKIVNIPNVDVEACGGIHLENTKDAEEIFIFRTKRIQDGVIRIEYVAGKGLVKKTKEKIKEEKVKRKKEYEEKMKEIKKLRELKNKLKDGEEKFIFEKSKGKRFLIKEIKDKSMKELQEISRELSTEDTVILLFGISEKIFVFGSTGEKTGVDIGKIVVEVCEELGGRGGGTAGMAQGFGTNIKKLKEVVEKVRKKLF